MQTLWSRIAQVRATSGACRCPQCIPSASGITRRAGTTAARGAPRYLTSSTLWYSGIFAAAATLDAGRKVQRREKWDNAIAEVRQELVEAQIEGEPHGKGRINDVDRQTGGQQDDVDPFLGLGPDLYDPPWPANTGPAPQRHNMAPESIFASPQRRLASEQRSWSPKKLEIIGISVDLLQIRTLLTLHETGYLDNALKSVPEEYAGRLPTTKGAIEQQLHSLLADLRVVWKCDSVLSGYSSSIERTPLHRFGVSPTEGSTYSPPRDLNLSLQRLFKYHRRQTISTVDLLAKMSFSLSQSTSPPNLNTFNTILVGLANVGQPEITRHVIAAVQTCQLRPNEVTITEILDHYTRMDDHAGFLRYVEKMRGKHSGLSLARSDIKITDAGRARLKPKEGEPEKIIQLPYPTPKVMTSLIHGLLNFVGFDMTMKLCKTFGEEGWGASISGLSYLLQDCTTRSDWSAGIAVWGHIKALEPKTRRHNESRERIPLSTYASMLALCRASEKRATYSQIWEQAMISYRDSIDVRKLRSMIGSHQASATMQTSPARHPLDAKHREAPQLSPQPEKLSIGQADQADHVASPEVLHQHIPFHELQEASALIQEPQGSLAWGMERSRELHVRRPNESTTTAGTHTNAAFSPVLAMAPASGTDKRARPPSPVASMEQLHGNVPGGFELDEYEHAERPMTLHG